MRAIFSILASAAGIYSIMIFIRIILSWFGNSPGGKPIELLKSATDPYLDWWRRSINLRIGSLDFSAVAAIAGLSLIQNIFNALSRYQRFTLGSFLAIVLQSVWNIASFIIFFCIVVIILRLIAYLTNRDTYSPFWKMVDSISQPLLYQIKRIIFGKRIVNYLNGIVVSLLALAAVLVAGRFIVLLVSGFLYRLPI